MITMNRLPDDIVEEKHVCYFVKRSDSFSKGVMLELYEVIDMKLKHPECPDSAFINDFDIRKVCEKKLGSVDAQELLLLEAAQNVVEKLLKGNKREKDK